MSIKPIPESIWKHRGDTAWLEEHGRAALAEYLSLNDKQDQTYAREAFVRDMFKNPKTCALFGRAPRWWREEQAESFDQFKADIAKIDPLFKNAWGGRNPWRDPLVEGTEGEAAADTSRAVTVVETRGRGRVKGK